MLDCSVWCLITRWLWFLQMLAAAAVWHRNLKHPAAIGHMNLVLAARVHNRICMMTQHSTLTEIQATIRGVSSLMLRNQPAKPGISTPPTLNCPVWCKATGLQSRGAAQQVLIWPVACLSDDLAVTDGHIVSRCLLRVAEQHWHDSMQTLMLCEP